MLRYTPVDYAVIDRVTREARTKHQENDHWFDRAGGLLSRVRNMPTGMSDEEIVKQLVEEGQASAEQVWLCLKAAAILDS